MFFLVNRVLIIVTSLLLAAGIAYSAYLMTRPFDVLNVFLYVMVGLILALLLILVFVVPLINRSATAKNMSKLEIRFYPDRLIALPAGQEEMGRGVSIEYKEFGRRFETRHSIVCIRGKAGVILSREDNLPQEIVDLLLGR